MEATLSTHGTVTKPETGTGKGWLVGLIQSSQIEIQRESNLSPIQAESKWNPTSVQYK